ncbi:MFS transporter [Paraburkholderia sp. SIMBA_050]
MQSLETDVMRKINSRLVPFLFIVYLVNFLDRVNLGFAALGMNKQLGFSASTYGLGAGIFFIGYLLFEIPSNLIMHKVGARIWITRIMLTWGCVAICMSLVRTASSFYTVRFLLGLAESGFVPGLLLYLTYWYPERFRAAATAKIWMATAIAVVVGSPISGALLSITWLGWSGWQWMFILEGIPAVLLAGVAIRYLTDRPENAKWLTAKEQEWLASELARDSKEKKGTEVTLPLASLTSSRVWLLAVAYGCLGCGFFGLNYWLPQIIKQASGASNIEVGFLSTLPFTCAAVGMISAGRWSDRTGKHQRLYVSALVCGAVCLAASGFLANPLFAFALLCVATMSVFSVACVFWSLPASFLSSRAAAAGFALINSVGAVGGFSGPFLIGWLRSISGGYSVSLAATSLILLISAIIVAAFKSPRAGHEFGDSNAYTSRST